MWTLFKKEIFQNFLDFRIQIICFTTIILTFGSILINLGEYKEQLDRYNLENQININNIQNNKVYATIKPKAIRPPYPLSIISKGVNVELGNCISFDLMNIPYEAEKISGTNPFLIGFNNFSISYIFIWLFSLFAILLSFDSITKENEQGTLKLILAGDISRISMLISKILAYISIISFILFLIFSFLLTLIIIFQWIDFSLSILIGLLIFIIFTLLYSIFWIMICVFISITNSRSSSSLIITLAVWIFLMIVIPSINVSLLSNSNFSQEKKYIQKMQAEEMSIYWQKHRETWVSKIEPLISSNKFGTFGGSPGFEPIWGANPYTNDAIKRFYNILNPLKVEIAHKNFRIAEDYFLNPYKKKIRWQETLAYLSPATLMESIFMKISRTHYNDYIHFFYQTLNYRNQILNYYNNNNVFNSSRWFTPETNQYPFNANNKLCPKDLDNISTEELKKLSSYYSSAVNDPKFKLQIDDFPIFKYKEQHIYDFLFSLIKPFVVILIAIFILFILNCFKINTYNVKN